MISTITIFITGIFGVFIGMALLYASIRVTSIIIDRLINIKEKK